MIWKSIKANPIPALSPGQGFLFGKRCVMGMGSFGVNSISFSYEDVKKLCPKEIEAIENHKSFSDWCTFALDARDLEPADEIGRAHV